MAQMTSSLALVQTMHAPLHHGQAASSGRPAAQMCSSSSRRWGTGRMQRAGRQAAVRAAAAAAGIEPIGGVRPEIDAAVQGALDICLTETDLGMGKKYRVRAAQLGLGRAMLAAPCIGRRFASSGSCTRPARLVRPPVMGVGLLPPLLCCRARCATHTTWATSWCWSPPTGRARLTGCWQPSPSRARCSTRPAPGGCSRRSTSWATRCWRVSGGAGLSAAGC